MRDPWEVRARKVVEPSEASHNYSFQGWGRDGSQPAGEGRGFPKILENLGQEEDAAIYFSIHSSGLGRWEEWQAGPAGGMGGCGGMGGLESEEGILLLEPLMYFPDPGSKRGQMNLQDCMEF